MLLTLGALVLTSAASVATAPRTDVVVVLGRMEASERYRALGKADSLLALLEGRPGVRVEIIDGPTVVQPPTDDLAQARAALKARDKYTSERPDWPDSWQAPVEQALRRLGSAEATTRGLVYFAAFDYLRFPGVGVPIYAVLMSRVDAPVPEGPAAIYNVTTVGGVTGGPELIVPDLHTGDSERARETASVFDRLRSVAKATGGIATLGDVQAVATRLLEPAR